MSIKSAQLIISGQKYTIPLDKEKDLEVDEQNFELSSGCEHRQLFSLRGWAHPALRKERVYFNLCLMMYVIIC